MIPSQRRSSHPDSLAACRVLVTPTSFGQGDPNLKALLEAAVGEVVYNPTGRPLSSAELAGWLKGIDGYIAGLDQIDALALAAAAGLKVIARYGVGTDRVDVASATRLGIVVTNTPGANAAAVAEMTIGLMLALGRNLCRADKATRRGEWPRLNGIGMKGKIVGLCGFGAIGREVASRLQGFGCRILVTDPFVKPEAIVMQNAVPAPLEEMLAAADFLSLHAALTPATSGMVDRSFLQTMKKGAFLINTARGELVDEDLLREFIVAGRLRGAALDCFRREPPGMAHPLFRLPQVLVTPHMASHTDEAAGAMGRSALQACLSVLRGERPAHVVNPEVFPDSGLGD